jgi:hypothetical protein
MKIPQNAFVMNVRRISVDPKFKNTVIFHDIFSKYKYNLFRGKNHKS